MNLLRAERIKLFSTRAPWWCLVIAAVASLGLTAAFYALAGPDVPTTVANTQIANASSRTVMLVVAVVATTAEFNWGTIRLTFQAAPARVPALLAKTTVVGLLCAFVGLVLGFAAWGIATLLQPDANLGLHTGADWRQVLGQGLVFALTGVLGVGVGLLLRSTALALTLVLVWIQLLEGLVVFIPGIGKHLFQWMPFNAVNRFAGADLFTTAYRLPPAPLGPWGSLGYFAAICVVLFAAGLVLVRRRDA